MFASSWITLLTSLSIIVDAYPSVGALVDLSSWQLSSRDSGNLSIQATSPFDHSWIETFASIGDSYSVGLGAGHYISATKGLELNTDCYQYSYGYPNLLNANGMIGVNPNRVFQYLGCSGALVPAIRDKQVPKMRNSQLITLSGGGNDANFATILNYCVYQWSTWFFWSCDDVLGKSKATIDAKQYTDDLKSMIQAIAKKLQNPTSRIYWVAYTKPWDTTSKDCDNVTWAFIRNYGFRQFLTQARRTAMNNLVDDVNSKIKAVCDATDQCVYVDPNPDVDALLGHYCEPGVDESYHWPGGGVSANREETWPYEWGTGKDDDTDDGKKEDQPQKRKRNDIPGTVDNTTFEGAIANWIALGVQKNEIDPTILASFNGSDFTAQGSLLPDRYGRIFHLSKWANGVVAMNIMSAMVAEQAKIMNEPAVTTTLKVCSTATLAATSTTSSPAATTCIGNQIQGSCVQGHEPSSTPDSGPIAPVCNKVDSTTEEFLRINDTQARKAATTYCVNLVSSGRVLDSNGGAPEAGTQPNAAEKGGTLELSVLFDADSCAPGTAARDQKIDFKALGLDQCFDALYTSISQYCSQDYTWGDYDPNYTLEGGFVGLHCGLWGLVGEPARKLNARR